MLPKKKVLILAYDFPPFISVGALRPVGWMQHLHEFGVYPIFVTRDWSHVTGDETDYIGKGNRNQLKITQHDTYSVIHVPFEPHLGNKMYVKYGAERFSFPRRLINAIYEFGQFFLPIGNKRSLYLTARKYLSKHPEIDAIIATGDPFVLFHYARKLSEEFKKPAIYDYRDPWSQGVNIENNRIYRYLSKKIEMRVLGENPVITTVSDFLCAKLKEMHPTGQFHLVSNGYMDIDTSNISYSGNRLKIAYAGSMYNWYPYQGFFETLSQLKNDFKLDIDVSFFGVNKELELINFIENRTPNIRQNITFINKLPVEQLYQELAKHHLLLLFNSFSFMGTKIYDYLAIQRNILLLFTNDDQTERLRRELFIIQESDDHSQSLQADLLQDTNSGISIEDPDHLKHELIAFDQELKQSGSIPFNSRNLDHFSRKYQTERLATIIHSVTK